MPFIDFYKLTYSGVLQKPQEFLCTFTEDFKGISCSSGTIVKCRSQQEGRRECTS